MIMKYQPPKYSDQELLTIFPEVKEIIPHKIKECQKTIRNKREKIKKDLMKIYALKSDSFSEWFGEEAIQQFEMPEITKLEKSLLRLKRFTFLLTPTKDSDRWSEFQNKLEIARNYPIETLARSKLEIIHSGKNFVALCPFHNEKTPSFYLYPETNKFYCFGCQEKGDILTLTMHLYGINFKEAVQMLQN